MTAISSEQQPLLEAVVESSTARRPKTKPEGSWVTLLGQSVVYVWPTALWLQLRAIVCVFLVIFMRCLNLAVPILYKGMVDTLSNITSDTRRRDPPVYHTFMEAFYPYVFLYLVAWVLQGGGAYRYELIATLPMYPAIHQCYCFNRYID